MLALCGLVCYDGRTPEQRASGAGMTTVVIQNTTEYSPLIVDQQPAAQGYAPQQQQQAYHSHQQAPQAYAQQPPQQAYGQQPPPGYGQQSKA